jgi:sterol desaturase/sphingolipid hydroxylase (fatty acid hydroxylase superfamily)
MAAAVLFVVPFVLLFGLPPNILAAYEAAQLAVGLVTHANICMPEIVERRARLFFVTPALHRFHHSVREAEANSNFCDLFSIWDRLFGTFQNVPRGIARPEQFGTVDVDPSLAGDFLTQLKLPLQRIAR